MHHVYMIKSVREDWFYVGSTSSLAKRLSAHDAGAVRSTKARRPFICVYTEAFTEVREARKREREIKLNRCKKEDILKDLRNKASSSNG